MKTLFLLLLLVLLGGAGPGAGRAAAQDLQPVINRQFQVKYQVPADWHLSRHRTDSLALVSYRSPDHSTQLWVGELRGPHRQLPPAQALQRLLRHLGATRHTEHNASAHGLDYLESTGTCRVNGRELRYDARVTFHQGHALVVYVYATADKFTLQEPLLHRLLDSLTPVPAHQAPHR